MKDARGHGSESHGARVARGAAPAAHQLKIQKLDTSLIGTPWRTVGSRGNRAVAERMAQNMRVDHANTLMRVR